MFALTTTHVFIVSVDATLNVIVDFLLIGCIRRGQWRRVAYPRARMLRKSLRCCDHLTSFWILVGRFKLIKSFVLLVLLVDLLSEHVFDLLFNGLRIELVSLDDVW